MKSLKTTTDLVKKIMEEVPDTRNSDNLLYIMVCKKLNPEVEHCLFFDVLKHQKELGLPSIESVGRARRKVRQHHPELYGSDNVEAVREENEGIFRDFARKKVI